MSIQGSVIRLIQDIRYEGTTIYLSCRRCRYTGAHTFAFMTEDPLKIIVTWGFFWTKKVFKCEKCGGLMYEDGELVITLFDRLDGFFHYPEIMQTINDLEFMTAQNQNLLSKYSREIIDLKNDFANVNSDKDLILEKLKSLRGSIQKEAA